MCVCVIGATEAGVMDSMEVCVIMVKIRMWACCVCVHDTRSIIAPPLPHPLGKTIDSMVKLIPCWALQARRLVVNWGGSLFIKPGTIIVHNTT